MNNLCFTDLIEKGQIRIPQIQRDYAQGRRNKVVDEIRDNFVRSLLQVVMGKKPEAQLDFVYGSDNGRDGAFEPLDGQQRLTTLFLLHWVLGVDLSYNNGESILTYETRNTSRAFCKELIAHNAKQFVEEAEEAKKKSNTNHEYPPSKFIRERDWFQWGWRFDPTINSMLVMIDTICKQMDWSLNLTECQERLKKITFNYLDLGQLGMSDELFIKMNARGKLLSDFDKLKSTLEEEIQQQQEEQDKGKNQLADANIETNWRKWMDGKWIDLFWQKYSKDISDKEPTEQLKVAKETEKKFRIFLLRMIAMQLFAQMSKMKKAAETNGEYDKVKGDFDKLYEAAYKNNEGDLNDLLLAYQNQLTNWRSNPEERIRPDYCITIDFKQLIDLINLWIIDEGNSQYTDVTTLLPEESSFGNSNITYFELFTDDKISYDVTAIIYAIQLFIKHFPHKKDNEQKWKHNFDEWTRMARNVFNNDNNTDRFNKRSDTAEAFGGIENMILDMNHFFQEKSIDIYSEDAAVLMFLKSLGNKTYIGIDNQSLEEEIDKATLRLPNDNGEIDEEWTKAIRKAEKDPYLWGQIRCLVHWSEGNLQKFQEYTNLLAQWISTKNEDEILSYYTAMLCLQPDCWKLNNRLYEFNKHRDNSLKRYLRDGPDYGKSIQLFIDKWAEWDAEASFQKFCEHVKESSSPTGWVKYLCEYPKIIGESWRKRFFEEKGHVIFAQQITTYSHCFDPMFLYLHEKAKHVLGYNKEKKWPNGVTVKLFDSKSMRSYGFEVTTPNNTYDIRWGENESEYKITINNLYKTTCDIDELVSSFNEFLNDIKQESNNLEEVKAREA